MALWNLNVLGVKEPTEDHTVGLSQIVSTAALQKLAVEESAKIIFNFEIYFNFNQTLIWLAIIDFGAKWGQEYGRDGG